MLPFFVRSPLLQIAIYFAIEGAPTFLATCFPPIRTSTWPVTNLIVKT